jgi:hypothetical protein
MSIVDPTATLYGDDSPLITRGYVEKNMLAHLQAQLESYLARVERLEGLLPGTISTPKSWEVINEFTRYPEEMMPFVAVISPGINPGRPPYREGDGSVKAWWMLAIGAVVSTRKERESKDLAGYYGAAIRGAVMEQPELGGWASGVDWDDEKYDDFPRVTERTIAAVRLVFTVEVENVVNVFGAPRHYDGSLIIPGDPYAPQTPYPEVVSAEADVTENGG